MCVEDVSNAVGSAQIHAGLSKSMWRPRGGSEPRRRDNPPPPHPTPLTLIGPEDRRVGMGKIRLGWVGVGLHWSWIGLDWIGFR